jgi:K(+)-stimulated pyrophosphate-energized sodium pump
VIKFTTLFGLLAVELGVQLATQYGSLMSHVLSAVFLVGSAVFVWRSFFGMRIQVGRG